MIEESKGKLGNVWKLPQIPIKHLILTAYLMRKTSHYKDSMGCVGKEGESEEK